MKTEGAEQLHSLADEVGNAEQIWAVAATFTAEPIEPVLHFWANELGIPAKIKFVPYNDLFQQLLEPDSLFARNRNGVNVVLLRLADWLRGADGAYLTLASRQVSERIEQGVADFISALRTAAARGAAPYVVCLCPPGEAAEIDVDHAEYFARVEQCIAEELKLVGGAYLVKSAELAAAYPVAPCYDAHADRLAHIPYTKNFYVALGSMAARKIHALQRAPYKVVVLDCDQTLWKGVYAEDGLHNIEIDAPRRALQEFIVAQHRAGMLICLCSKNDEADIAEIFERGPDMPLKREHILSWRVNWRPKSENLRALAEELRLGLDSFIVIDDDPVVCAEIEANCPEVVTLLLPSEPDHIPRFLHHAWVFDRLKVTVEDTERTALYRHGVERERERKNATSFADFLEALNLQVRIETMEARHLSRVAQLTQRTNQFNLSNIRRSETDIQKLCGVEKFECLAVEVSDRFGDCGLVGAIIFKATDEALQVDTFLLSCRALGRGVENQMLARLGELAQARGLDYVDVTYLPARRNQAVLEFLDKWGAPFKKALDHGCHYRFPACFAALLDTVDAAAILVPRQIPSHVSSAAPQRRVTTHSTLWRRIAVELCDCAQIGRMIDKRKQRLRAASQQEEQAVSGGGSIEEILLGIWRQVLEPDELGVHDNFFDAGGDSLQATQIIARIRQALQVDVSLHTFFAAPSVKELAAVLHAEHPAASAPASQPAPPAGGCRVVAASFAQQRLWFLQQLAPDSPAYNVTALYRLCGPLQLAVLAQSVNEIVRRHETLRTSFNNTAQGLMQIVHPSAVVEPALIDLRTRPRHERESEALRLAAAAAREPFDLGRVPLLRVSLLRLDEREYLVLFVFHHTVYDGWSTGIFTRELDALYRFHSGVADAALPPPAMQYADFAQWQRQSLQGDALRTQMEYWRRQLTPASAHLNLPVDRPCPAMSTLRGARFSGSLPRALGEKLKAFSRGEDVTLFMTLLTAFQTFLHRYSGQHDVTVGTPIAGRTRLEAEALIGCFVNTLALRIDLSGDPSFREALQRVRQTAMDAYAHQDLPFERLVEELQPERGVGHNPLFQVMFVLQNTPQHALSLGDLQLTPLPIDTGTAKFDLTLIVNETEQGLRYQWEYNTDLFDAATVERWAGHYATLLDDIVAHPDKRLSELALLTEAERHQLLHAWTATTTAYPRDVTLAQLFEAQAQAHPDAVALVYEHASLTYSELNQRANALAHHLQAHGAGPEVRIGLCLERSLDLLVGLLAILKAGAAYVPLDPSYPSERLRFLLEDAGITLLLTHEHLRTRLPDTAVPTLCLDSEWVKLRQHYPDHTPVSAATADSLAYIIYTSGSTGQPKGVLITHYNVVRLLRATEAWFHFTCDDAWTLFHSYAFDFSVWEIWGALAYGGRLVVVPYEVSRSPENFYALLYRQRITVLNQTPSAFRQLVHAERRVGRRDLALRTIIFGGEALDLQSLKPWFERHGDQMPRLVNMYGITETTVHVTYRPLTRVDLQHSGSPIGIPMPDIELYLLDRNLQPVPIGVPGELYVGGAGLARGYHNRAELTAERFIPHPYSSDPQARLYKSGDLARLCAGGELDYLGRADSQVKIRGFRIELGEIEAVLAQHPAVRECAVLAREDTPGDPRLVAYLAGAEPHPGIAALRAHVQSHLPEYMTPAAWVWLNALPLTAHGKLDRAALPAPDSGRAQIETAYSAPQNEMEQIIANVWQEALQLEKVGIHDNFFDLGGHSLRMAQVQSALRETLNIELPIIKMFQHPTIHTLAQYLSVGRGEMAQLARVRDRAQRQRAALAARRAEGRL
ncbi:MAG: amino acid adenylation domain-containing protein [Pseudomonadota bacterium]